ncbi:MAG: periplasmic heavy metal sensor [Desulfobacterales bacterium]
MKRFLALVFVNIFLIMGLNASAGAQWWQDKALREKLQLKEQQLQKMNRLFNAYKEKRIERSAEAQKLQLKLNNLLTQEKLDEKAVDQTQKTLIQARMQMFQEMLGMKLAVRKVLMPDQIRLLLSEDARIFSTQKRWAGMSGRRPTRGRVVINKKEKK